MEITLLGTGDTTGTPTPGCECETCEYARNNGISRSRFSVHVRNEETNECLLVDFSPDFRTQMLSNDVKLPDAGIITHVHFDHLDGLGNVYRLLGSARTGDYFPVYAADEYDPNTGETVAETINDKYAYLDSLAVNEIASYETFDACGFDITLVPVNHPPLLCYGVVIEQQQTDAKLSITGDTNFQIPERSRQMLSDPDLLLADGIVPPEFCNHHPIGGRDENGDGVPRTFGTKHMTRTGAEELADELNATNLRIVHVAHYYPVDQAFDDQLAVDGEVHTI